MRYRIVYTHRFTKSFKRVKQFRGFKIERLDYVINLLAAGERLPEQFRDHALSGAISGYRECHLSPDILLIYKISDDVLVCSLADTGNHAQLF